MNIFLWNKLSIYTYLQSFRESIPTGLRYHSGRWTENNRKFFGWTQSDNTKTTFPRSNFKLFYAFKMAVAIAFFCVNAVEAIWISCISMILTLNGFYSIYVKKRDSHGHLKCIKKLKITPKSCCFSAIMMCSIYFELFYLDQ